MLAGYGSGLTINSGDAQQTIGKGCVVTCDAHDDDIDDDDFGWCLQRGHLADWVEPAVRERSQDKCLGGRCHLRLNLGRNADAVGSLLL